MHGAIAGVANPNPPASRNGPTVLDGPPADSNQGTLEVAGTVSVDADKVRSAIKKALSAKRERELEELAQQSGPVGNRARLQLRALRSARGAELLGNVVATGTSFLIGGAVTTPARVITSVKNAGPAIASRFPVATDFVINFGGGFSAGREGRIYQPPATFSRAGELGARLGNAAGVFDRFVGISRAGSYVIRAFQ